MARKKAESVDLDDQTEEQAEESKEEEASEEETQEEEQDETSEAASKEAKHEASTTAKQPPKGKLPKGKLVVCSPIKEGGEILKVGDTYKGNNGLELFNAGVIQEA